MSSGQLSKFAKEVVAKALGDVKGTKNNNVEYSVSVSDNRLDSTIMANTFKFRKPIPISQVEADLPEFLAILDKYLIAQNLGVVDAVLTKYGLQAKKMGTSTVTGTLPISTEDAGALGLDEDTLTSIRTISGRFISLTNFKALLEIAMRSYMLKHMTAGGPQLHNRTGRFINNSTISSVTVVRGLTGRHTIRIIFTYMMYPYHTFDPSGPNSRGLASEDRNPRRIIGEAINKAVDDMVSTQFYNIEVLQL